MQSHVQKWGNSLGLRIPMQLAKKLNIHAGSAVTVEVEDGKFTVQPVRYELDAMLSEITTQNLHHECFGDDIRGQEEW